jgi:hypothetical protein
VFCSIVKNFPMERGAVVGIAKAWVGLCGGILTQLYVGFVGKPDDSKATLNFVLMMAGAAAFAAAVPSLFVVIHKQQQKSEPYMWGKLGFCYVVVLSMAALVTLAALVGDGMDAGGRRGFAIGILCVLISPMLITLPFGDTRSTAGSIQESLMSGKDGSTVDEEEERRIAAEAVGLPQKTIGQMMGTMNCWLLWLGVASLSGGGQLVSANVNQMCESLGYGRPAVAVSLFAVGNGLGRILAGNCCRNSREHFNRNKCGNYPCFFAISIENFEHLLACFGRDEQARSLRLSTRRALLHARLTCLSQQA